MDRIFKDKGSDWIRILSGLFLLLFLLFCLWKSNFSPSGFRLISIRSWMSQESSQAQGLSTGLDWLETGRERERESRFFLLFSILLMDCWSWAEEKIFHISSLLNLGYRFSDCRTNGLSQLLIIRDLIESGGIARYYLSRYVYGLSWIWIGDLMDYLHHLDDQSHHYSRTVQEPFKDITNKWYWNGI